MRPSAQVICSDGIKDKTLYGVIPKWVCDSLEGLPIGSGAPSATAFDSKGQMFVLTCGPIAFLEFDANGRFTRSFDEGLFTRSHGLHIDQDDNLWVADVCGHIVQS